MGNKFSRSHVQSRRGGAAYSVSYSVCSSGRFKSTLAERLYCGFSVSVGLVGLTEDKRSYLFCILLYPQTFLLIYVSIFNHFYNFTFQDVNAKQPLER